MSTAAQSEFDVFADFIDGYGCRIRVIGSGIGKSPHVWIFTDADGAGVDSAAHLSTEEARAVRDALTMWLDDGPTAQAFRRAVVGEDAYCDLTDTIDPGADEQ